MAPPSDLAASLRRRQLARDKMKRYWHTRSFNTLAGRSTAPGVSHPVDHSATYRVVFCIGAALLFGVGVCYLF